MSSGANIRLYYVEEVEKGKIPEDAKLKGVRRITDSLTESVETETSESVGSNRFRQGSIVSTTEVTGTLETELSILMFDDFWSAVAMNDWAVNKLEFGGKNLKTFTFVKVYEDLDLAFCYSGVAFNEATLTIGVTGKITASFGLIGMGFVKGKLSDPGNTELKALVDAADPVEDMAMVSTPDVKSFKVNGETTVNKACAQNFELTISNNIEAIRCIGSGSTQANNLVEKMVDVEVTSEFIFSKDSVVYVDAIKDRSIVSMELNIVDPRSKTKAYTIELPHLEVSSVDHPDGGGEDTIMISPTFAHTMVTPIFKRVTA